MIKLYMKSINCNNKLSIILLKLTGIIRGKANIKNLEIDGKSSYVILAEVPFILEITV